MDGVLVRTADAAHAVGLSPSFLFKNSSRLPGVYRAGRSLRWDVCELKRWMADQAKATAQQGVQDRVA